MLSTVWAVCVGGCLKTAFCLCPRVAKEYMYDTCFPGMSLHCQWSVESIGCNVAVAPPLDRLTAALSLIGCRAVVLKCMHSFIVNLALVFH